MPTMKLLRLSWFFAVALLLLCIPSRAWAHGRLKGSAPADGAHLSETPREIRLDFSETPELAFTAVRLIARGGREIPLTALAYASDSHRAVVATVRGGMVAGEYTVAWQMAGDDGHVVRGQFEFIVAPGATGTRGQNGSSAGAASAAAMEDSMSGGYHHDPASMPGGNGFGSESVLYVLLRWLEYSAILLLIGAVSFRYLVIGYLSRDKLSEGEAAEPEFLIDAERRAARIAYIGVGVLGATLVLRLAAQSFAMHGAADFFNGRLVTTMVTRTMWGWGWLIQLVGILVAGFGLHRAYGLARGARRAGAFSNDTHVWWTITAIGTLIIAFSPAFSGHAASAPKLRTLAVLADGVHVLGASSWLGTLALVLLAGLPAIKDQPLKVRGALTRSLINGFSPVALTSAGVAMTTGVFAAWIHVGAIPNLWGTRYGVTLLIKLAILAIVALTGFYNWRFVKPRLGTEEASVHLQRSARIEVGVAVLVLLVTAVLVASPTSMDMTM